MVSQGGGCSFMALTLCFFLIWYTRFHLYDTCFLVGGVTHTRHLRKVRVLVTKTRFIFQLLISLLFCYFFFSAFEEEKRFRCSASVPFSFMYSYIYIMHSSAPDFLVVVLIYFSVHSRKKKGLGEVRLSHFLSCI